MTAARRVTSRLSSGSQTVIPKYIRDHLGVGLGDLIAFEERAGELVIPPVRAPLGEDLFATFTEWASAEDEEAYVDL